MHPELPQYEFHNKPRRSGPIQMGPSSDTIAIPPRTEVFRVFNIKNFKEPCLVEKRELSPGIFTADVIAYDN